MVYANVLLRKQLDFYISIREFQKTKADGLGFGKHYPCMKKKNWTFIWKCCHDIKLPTQSYLASCKQANCNRLSLYLYPLEHYISPLLQGFPRMSLFSFTFLPCHCLPFEDLVLKFTFLLFIKFWHPNILSGF